MLTTAVFPCSKDSFSTFNLIVIVRPLTFATHGVFRCNRKVFLISSSSTQRDCKYINRGDEGRVLWTRTCCFWGLIYLVIYTVCLSCPCEFLFNMEQPFLMGTTVNIYGRHYDNSELYRCHKPLFCLRRWGGRVVVVVVFITWQNSIYWFNGD